MKVIIDEVHVDVDGTHIIDTLRAFVDLLRRVEELRPDDRVVVVSDGDDDWVVLELSIVQW